MRVNRYNIEQTESYFLWASNLHQGSYVYCAGTSSRAQRGTSTIQIDPWGLAGEGGSGNGSLKSDIGASPWSTFDPYSDYGIFDSWHEYRQGTPLSPGVDRWHWGYRHRYASSRTRWASDNAGPLPFHGDGQFVGNNLNAGNVGGLKSGGEIGFRSGRGTASNPIVYREVVVEAQGGGGGVSVGGLIASVATYLHFYKSFSPGAYDFAITYQEMIQANWRNSDKYFHAKANFLAAHRGSGGMYFAIHFSNLREIWDQNVKGDLLEDCQLDQEANRFGRSQATYFLRSDYQRALEKYRPKSLPPSY